ncbi:hypothetical protein VRK_41380 [Vibrio sp. MEBiC08052]|nr:hypothetical protein VRK_41380 [Vibrio sp. MEBiC08052]
MLPNTDRFSFGCCPQNDVVVDFLLYTIFVVLFIWRKPIRSGLKG